MKVTERTIAKIAQLSLNPIMERLAGRARDEVAENFCKPKCGIEIRVENNFCPDAYITYGELLKHLFMEYSRLN